MFIEVMSEVSSIKEMPHHEQHALCKTRARYRQGKKLTATKVYTVNDESRHLLIFGVPSIAIHEELENLCRKFGELDGLSKLSDYPREEFTDVHLFTYKRLTTARFAKRHLDNRSFFGGVLHVCYAPELETLEDTREKLLDRRKSIHLRTCSTPYQNRDRFYNQIQGKGLKRKGSHDLHDTEKKYAIWNETGDGSNPQIKPVTGADSSVNTVFEYAPELPMRPTGLVPHSRPTNPTSSIALVPRQVSLKRIVFKEPKCPRPSGVAKGEVVCSLPSQSTTSI